MKKILLALMFAGSTAGAVTQPTMDQHGPNNPLDTRTAPEGNASWGFTVTGKVAPVGNPSWGFTVTGKVAPLGDPTWGFTVTGKLQPAGDPGWGFTVTGKVAPLGDPDWGFTVTGKVRPEGDPAWGFTVTGKVRPEGDPAWGFTVTGVVMIAGIRLSNGAPAPITAFIPRGMSSTVLETAANLRAFSTNSTTYGNPVTLSATLVDFGNGVVGWALLSLVKVSNTVFSAIETGTVGSASTYVVAVSNVAADLVPVELVGAVHITIQNLGNQSVYVGGSDVAASGTHRGFQLSSGGSMTFDGAKLGFKVYAIRGGASDQDTAVLRW